MLHTHWTSKISLQWQFTHTLTHSHTYGRHGGVNLPPELIRCRWMWSKGRRFLKLGKGQNFYRQTTVEFIRYDVCWFKTWCTGIFLWWQNFYIGIIVWDIKCGTVWENTVSVDFKHGVCGYFYGENLARQYICGDIILRYRVSSKTCSLFYDLSAKTHLNAKFGGTSKK